MRQNSMIARALLSGLTVCLMAGSLAQADPFGIGSSKLTDAKAAGQAAAKAAKAKLDGPANLVLVFNENSLAGDAEALLAGVAEEFDAKLIFGANGYAVIGDGSSDALVTVFALSADAADVAVAVADSNDVPEDRPCGKSIGESLKESYDAAQRGKFVMLFGDCHVPRDNDVVLGVRDVLGDDVTCLGAAALGGATYIEGKVVHKKNVGILISGQFDVGYSLQQDMSKDGLIESARTAMAEAIGDRGNQLAMVFVFDCGGRRGAMLKNGNYAEEVAAMKSVAGGAPLFGFYGSGEIGRAVGDPSCGVGYHVATGAILVD